MFARAFLLDDLAKLTDVGHRRPACERTTMTTATPQIAPWFAALIDPVHPPTSFESAVALAVARHTDWRSLLPPATALRVDWSGIDLANPRTDWWLSPEHARVDGPPTMLHAITLMLVLMQTAMQRADGMPVLIAAWVAERRRGSGADSNRVPLLARESNVYGTTMTDATEAERASMRAYDAAFEALLQATAPPLYATIAGLSAVLVLNIAGFEGRLSARAIAQLGALGSGDMADAARRSALGMPSYHRFETPAIEAMTMESVVAATRNDALNDAAIARVLADQGGCCAVTGSPFQIVSNGELTAAAVAAQGQ